MAKIVFDTATTLDGWIADPDNSLAWLFAVEGGEEPDPALLPTSKVQVMGSTTYQWLLDHTGAVAAPEEWVRANGGRSTVVFSTRDLAVPEGADVTLVNGPVTEAMDVIRAAADGGDVWVVGGGDLAGQFLDAGLLDEIALSVAPAALGGGAPLLPRVVGPDRLRLVSAAAHGQFARLVYEVRPLG